MKTVLLAFLIFLVNSISFAQLDSSRVAHSSYSSKPSPLFLQPDAPLQKEWLPPGYRMRKVGATLTLAGAFLIIGGVIVDKSSTLDVAPLMIVGGAGMVIPGIIFWTKGATTYRIYQAEQAAGTTSLRLTANGIIYRF